MLAGEDLVLNAKDIARVIVHRKNVNTVPFTTDREAVAVHKQIVEDPVASNPSRSVIHEAADHAVV